MLVRGSPRSRHTDSDQRAPWQAPDLFSSQYKPGGNSLGTTDNSECFQEMKGHKEVARMDEWVRDNQVAFVIKYIYSFYEGKKGKIGKKKKEKSRSGKLKTIPNAPTVALSCPNSALTLPLFSTLDCNVKCTYIQGKCSYWFVRYGWPFHFSWQKKTDLIKIQSSVSGPFYNAIKNEHSCSETCGLISGPKRIHNVFIKAWVAIYFIKLQLACPS